MPSVLPTKNLVLVTDESRCDPADFIDIANRIRTQAPDIRVQVLQPKTIYSIARDTWGHPTLFVGLLQIPNLRIKRGRLMMPSSIPKLRQAEMMRLAGVSTPHVEPYQFGMTFDESTWGSHVILKPMNLNLSSNGAGLEVIACNQLAERREEDLPPDHFMRTNKMLVQRFIDTGTHPVLYRAMTFMGEVLTIYRVTYVRHKPEGSTHMPTDFHSKSTEATRDFNYYPHVHAFARKTAAAFANWPLLGCDILEEHGTGKLYALEVNAGGNVWHFSSPYNAKQRAAHPEYNAPRLNQYGAFDVAAKALINATRRLAV